jgi:hypothetical protein
MGSKNIGVLSHINEGIPEKIASLTPDRFLHSYSGND